MDKQLLQKIIWSYGEDGAKISVIIAAVGTYLTAMLGGWDNSLQALLLFMVADFVIGFVAAIKNKAIDSKIMFWGGINKVLVLVLVGIGTVLDKTLGMGDAHIRAAIIWFYMGREGLSLVENYGKMGLPLPKFLVNILGQLKAAGDGGKNQ